MDTGTDAFPYVAEKLPASRLLIKWKEITSVFLAGWHAEELYQEPDSHSRVAPGSSNDAFANADEVASGSDESESDYDVYDKMAVPSFLFNESADLSKYYHADSPLTFDVYSAQSAHSHNVVEDQMSLMPLHTPSTATRRYHTTHGLVLRRHRLPRWHIPGCMVRSLNMAPCWNSSNKMTS